VWTPQTGWIGPAGAVKDSPKEQLDFALSFFEKADYDKARIEFKKLLKHYKDALEAREAQYHLGRCHEEQGDYYAAFLDYRKTIQVYPSTTRFEEIVERMYQIGNYFLGGKRRKILGTMAIMPARDKAIEVFQAIVEDGPFSRYGELAQYKLGIANLALGEYEQAVSAFEQLIDRYPNSPLVDDARFQIAQASLKGTFKPGYDQHPTDQAIEQLEAFVEEHPESDLTPEAVERRKALLEQRAAHEFQVAEFYERQGQIDSAVIYYDAIVDRYAQTPWASKAAGRLEALKPLLQ
ncbi:MAG: outer membrane protein assembly factor BamD, partial [Candidatus Omnitrophica bacterium]|nr:outer membrane protein assembly factor BamD [Candidatus Omnitrophota bacterium]